MPHGEANIWQPRTLIEVSANTKAVEERITATAGQSLFTLQTFTYVLGTGALEVHKNGLLLTKGVDWVEGTTSTFSLVVANVAGDQIVATGHVGITGTVDVRDTDIFVSNYQAIRDYVGTEITLFAQGNTTLGDGGEFFFEKITGEAAGFFVDNNYNIIVPTGGDGSIGWVCTTKPFVDIANAKKFSLAAGVTGSTTAYTDGWAATLKGPVGGAPYVVVTKAEHDIVRGTSTVDELGDHTLPNANVLLLRTTEFTQDVQYGCKADGVTDDTVALNALSVAKDNIQITGFCFITDKVTFRKEQLVKGVGRKQSGFKVDGTFNLAATAIIDFGSAEAGPQFRDLGISCFQDTTATLRSQLIQYPPAIRAVNCPRFFIENCRISAAFNGIDATGNSGGMHINDVEISALNKGILANGSLDFLYFDNIQFWPFDFVGTSLETNVWQDGLTIGMELIDCDGLSFGTVSAFRAKHTIDGCFGNISSLLCDGAVSNLEIKGGTDLAIGSFYSTTNAIDDFALKMNAADGNVSIGSAWIEGSADLTGSDGFIQVAGDATCEVVISSLYMKTAGGRLIHQQAGNLTISSGFLEPPANFSNPDPLIEVVAGRISLGEINVRDKGTGTGSILKLTVDDQHSISGLTAPGWPIELPATSSNIKLNAIESSVNVVNTRIVNDIKYYQFTGVFDGSGNFTIAHGLPAPHLKLHSLSAFRISGAANNESEFTIIDGANVLCNTGNAGFSGQTVEIVLGVIL